jgi:hypothetical protein
MCKELTLHTDAGHGWLEVPLSDVIALGIAGKVSRYSYAKGEAVYLEEDGDASLYLNQLTALGVEFSISEAYREHSPIRAFNRFTA